MPGNALIKFSGLTKGESLQTSHPSTSGWLQIGDWSFDIEAETNYLKGTGASVGVAAPGVFSFSHSFDLSSPSIMSNIVMGTSFNTVLVHMLKSTGGSQPQVFFGVKMTDGFITKVSSKGDEEGAVTQDVELVFKTINIGYIQQPNGNGGALDGIVREFAWSFANRTSSTGTTILLDPAKD